MLVAAHRDLFHFILLTQLIDVRHFKHCQVNNVIVNYNDITCCDSNKHYNYGNDITIHRNFAQQMNTLKPYTSYNEAYGAFTPTKKHLQKSCSEQMTSLEPYTSDNEAYGAFTPTKEHLQKSLRCSEQMNSLEPYTSDNEAYGVFTKEHLQESCYETIK